MVGVGTLRKRGASMSGHFGREGLEQRSRGLRNHNRQQSEG